MAVIRPKTVIDFKLTGTAENHACTRLEGRDVTGYTDEPAVRGGTNKGFTPTETLVAALIGCTNVIGSRVAEKLGLHVEDMRIEAVASFDRRGVMLEEELDVPFPSIALTISCRASGTAAQHEQWKRDLARFCPVSKVIRASGTELTETWSISPL